MVSIALAERGQVNLTPATRQAAESFNKMGFRTPDGQLLKVDAAGPLKGALAEAFKAKMATFERQ
jgi:hypothetical protein